MILHEGRQESVLGHDNLSRLWIGHKVSEADQQVIEPQIAAGQAATS